MYIYIYICIYMYKFLYLYISIICIYKGALPRLFTVLIGIRPARVHECVLTTSFVDLVIRFVNLVIRNCNAITSCTTGHLQAE